MSTFRGTGFIRLAAAVLVLTFGAGPEVAGAVQGGIGPGGSLSVSAGAGSFPVRGSHSYGDGLGAGRGHQGQDIMAKCGRPVVAAQPGMVRVKSFQAAGAGNYVVIKDRASGHDYVYMHMRKRLSVTRGERVRAGDLIGRVGSTGRSSACHLHFEMWKLPGWYKGGKLFNPTPFLKRWDRKR